MKKIKNFLLENKIFLLLFLLCFAFIFFDFIFLDVDYNIGYDVKNHFVPFYTEFKRLIGSGEMPFWSWNFFLGTNIIASKSYYFISDLFTSFLFFFPNLEILDVMFIMQLAKCLLSFLLMNCFLKEFTIKKSLRFLFSTLYSFSSFTFIFLGIPMFLTFSTFLPLLFISIEKFIKRGDLFLISLSSFLLICSSYYLFWSVSIFLLLYWPIRYFLTNSFTLKPFLTKTLQAIGMYCLGALLYAPILFPTIDYMVNNSRVTATSSLSLFWPKKIYLDMFIKTISAPFYVNTEVSNYFGTTYYRTDQIALYASVIPVLFVPQIFVIPDKKKKRLLCLFYFLLALLLFLQPGGSLMHGLSEPSFRWTLFIIFSNLTLSAILWDRGVLNIKIMMATCFAVFMGVAIVFVVVKHPFEYPSQTLMVLFSLFCLCLYCTLFFFLKKKPKLELILISLVLFEIIFSSKLTLKEYLIKNNAASYDYDSLGIPFDYFEKLQESNGNEFYRIYVASEHTDIDHEKEFNYNSNMIYNFKGVYGYDSTYQTSLDDFLTTTQQYYWWFSETDYRIHDFLSVKYYVVESKGELTHDNFKLIEKIGDSNFYLFENEQYLPFGYTASQLMSTEEFNQFESIYDQYELIRSTAIINQQDIDTYHLQDYIHPEVPQTHLENLNFTNNHVQGELTLSSKQLLILTIPYDKGWQVTVDHQEVTPLITSGGFIGIPIEEGLHRIELNFIPYGFKQGLFITGVSLFLIAIFTFIHYKKSKN